MYKVADVWTVDGKRHINFTENGQKVIYAYPSCLFEKTFQTFDELYKYIDVNFPFYHHTSQSIYIPTSIDKDELDIYKEGYLPVTYTAELWEVVPTVYELFNLPVPDAIEYLIDLRKELNK